MLLIAWLEFARFLVAFWPIVVPFLFLFWGLCCAYLAVLGVRELAEWLEGRFASV